MTSSGKTSAWVRVLGEFVVIVVGVLVALSLENWTADRADRVTELTYLDALGRDLRRDSALLTNLFVPGSVRSGSDFADIAPILRGEAAVPIDTIGFLRQVIGTSRTPIQVGSRTTYEELLATGSLRLIESPNVRSAIVGYYERKRSTESRAADRSSGYADLVRSHLPEFVSGSASAAATPEASEQLIRSFGVERAIGALHTQEFVEAMNRHINYNDLVRPLLASMLDYVEALLTLIDGEVERLH